jgi:hypothetical protein
MKTDAEIEALVRSFERATLPKREWTHREHLIVALWYLLHHPRGEATGRIRDGIQNLNRAHGNSRGYHETITLAWVAVITGFLDEHGRDRPVSALAGALLEACGERSFLFRFYSRPTLMSDRARHAWVPPDLRPIEPAGPPAHEVDPSPTVEHRTVGG